MTDVDDLDPLLRAALADRHHVSPGESDDGANTFRGDGARRQPPCTCSLMRDQTSSSARFAVRALSVGEFYETAGVRIIFTQKSTLPERFRARAGRDSLLSAWGTLASLRR